MAESKSRVMVGFFGLLGVMFISFLIFTFFMVKNFSPKAMDSFADDGSSSVGVEIS